LIAQHRFDAAAASAECSIIMIGPHDEPGIPVFGYYGIRKLRMLIMVFKAGVSRASY